jgi:hypothetical protein
VGEGRERREAWKEVAGEGEGNSDGVRIRSFVIPKPSLRSTSLSLTLARSMQLQ